MPKDWNATKVKGGMDEENTWAEALVGGGGQRCGVQGLEEVPTTPQVESTKFQPSKSLKSSHQKCITLT